jgi:4,5-dihydroxyphthalate decarboxylase
MGKSKMTLPLSLALTRNPRTWPVIDGRITAPGIDFRITTEEPGEIFWRQLKFADFDVSEMSLSSLMMALDRGDDRFVGLPVFTTRRFFHTYVLVRKDAHIDAPADLKGKRVGVREYQQTAALWIRGAIENEFGVSPRDMEFWMERLPTHSHGGSVGFTPPAGVRINQIPEAKNIGSMMLSGELDACLFYFPNRNMINRSSADLDGHPAIKPLFPDAAAEGLRFYRKTSIYPINHCMMVRRSLVERQPELLDQLLDVFVRANAVAERERMEHIAYHLETGLLPATYREIVSTALIQHGIEPNRPTLESAALYSQQQGLTSRLLSIADIFGAHFRDR